ncbi:tRNA lysidine(34) synthetase TilS [Kaistella carnis]|uniref:tRNA lysidine(34) synthetase TilS n=1 Tax=Kaistella carnis TaxID=1241979 RepID=UPI00289730DE|nr:tRNA lysidine(34) synthetase TilS [Kaistella carnis]
MLNTQTFQHSLDQICADYRNSKFLLAISGGVDSMVLFELFKDLKVNIQVAHVNYKLRGEASNEDQYLVEKTCAKSNIPLHLYSVTEQDKKPQHSIQEWARNLRYDFFRKIKEEQNIDFIVTAHHLNDQLETFIINLSKASGIKGLSGIPANENNILRPLLCFSKEDIYDFAKENNIEFREDQSNQKNDYLRNKIRNQIVPKLLEVNDNFLENFGKSISYLNQTKDFVKDQIAKIEEELISEEEDHSHLKKELFFKQSDFVRFEILRKYGFNDRQEIAKIENAETGKIFLSNEYQLMVDRETLILQKLSLEKITKNPTEIPLNQNFVNEFIIPEAEGKEIAKLGTFSWDIDGDKIHWPLKIRPRKEGDFFYPIGMIGKKKISKFFKDEKIPILAQQKIRLLCDANDEVIGIMPLRQDRRFAATKDSKNKIKVKL